MENNAPAEYAAASYGIDTDEDAAHIFNVLRNQIYSRKLLAISREYMTNAQDEHIACGKPSLPIEIKVPTAASTMFHVRDYGRGLTQEQVFSVYARYGKSTKRGVAGYNGQLGLGAKAAFCYTDSWLISSYIDGTKTIYNAAIDDSGVGKIYKLMESPTLEPNGVKIEIDIRRQDIWHFQRELQAFCQFFNPRPQFSSDSEQIEIQDMPEELERVGNVAFCKSADSCRLVMANVAYTIDYRTLVNSSTFATKLDDETRNWFAYNYNNIIIYANPGDVMISASRESLDYREKTISFIASSLSAVVAGLKDKFKARVDAATTAAEAHREIWDIRQLSNLVPTATTYFGLSGAKMQFRGSEYKSVFPIPKDREIKCYGLSSYNRYKPGAGYVTGVRADTLLVKDAITTIADQGILVLFDIPAKEAVNRIKAAAIADNVQYWCQRYIGIEIPADINADQFFDGIEPSLLVKASSLPEVQANPEDAEIVETQRVVRAAPRKLDKEKRKSKLFVPRRSEEDRSAKSKNWDAGELKDGDTGYYIEIDSFAPVDLKGHSWDLANLFDELQRGNLIEEAAKLFGVRSKDLEIAKSEGLLSFKSKLEELAEYRDEETAIALAAGHNVFLKLAKSAGVQLMSNAAVKKSDELFDVRPISEALGRGRWAPRPAWQDEAEKLANRESAEFVKSFPMLGLCDKYALSRARDQDLQNIMQYIAERAGVLGIPLQSAAADQPAKASDITDEPDDDAIEPDTDLSGWVGLPESD